MTDGKPTPPKPVVLRPRPDAIRDLVRHIATDTSKIAWSTHALERMRERDITDAVALEVLRRGQPKGEIEPGNNPGEWKVKMVRAIKGRREVGVVVLTIHDRRLLVKTAEWEDLT
jgi:hypothetical protein